MYTTHPSDCALCSLANDLLRVVDAGASYDEALAELTPAEQSAVGYHWPALARDAQQLPPGDWTYWLVKSGRGWGKTRVGAETVRQWVRDGHRYVNLISATADNARDVMVQGESGILAICPHGERPEYKPSQRKLVWPSGAESLIFSAEEPDRLRGQQHDRLWCDELAAWRYPEAWDQAKFGLRLGKHPQAIITTTPRPTKIIREIMADPATVITHGATYENRDNLAPAFLATVIKKYEGTRIGRQEIAGEVLEDNPGALFKREDIDKGRVLKAPELQRIVVAIDPAATNTETSDDTGIVVAGIATVDGVQHGYILHDLTCHETPNGWARKAVQAYHGMSADRIIGEANNGGDMIEAVIRGVDTNVSYCKVTATRGKEIRAEPIASLYEQGRIHHVGSLAALEDEMCSWDPQDKSAASPNRLDALVWALTDLMLGASSANFAAFVTRSLAKEQRKEHVKNNWRD